MSSVLVACAMALAALSGAPALRSAPARAVRACTVLGVLASLTGMAGSVWVLGFGGASTWGGLMRVDSLAALFLFSLFLVAGLGAIYAEGYWTPAAQPRTWRKARFFYGTLTAGIAGVLCADQAIFLLGFWEVMALSAFFLVLTESDKAEARRAAFIYLLATHTSTLLLYAVFALLRASSGTYSFVMLPGGVAGTAAGTATFVLMLAAFGTKAGLMPLHIWLPPAHAAAPSHVSALMSGVLIKTGIYGLIRFTSLFPDPPDWWGGTLVAAGLVSGIMGVAYALGQHDLKRLLAYHSVENIGIIAMGVGLALLGRSHGQARWVVLGLAGAVLHVLNHGMFKASLFFAAGSVVHACGTREMDRLGGLLKVMPRTGAGFLVGAVAICGLPPLNGFVSEWLLYLGLLDALLTTTRGAWVAGAAGVPGLAVIGTLALACFVKAFGAVFLGAARTDATAHAHEAPRSMLFALGVLSAACAFIGVLPVLVVPVLDRVVAGLAPGLLLPSLAELAPLGTLSLLAAGLVVLLYLCWRVLRARRVTPDGGTVLTWDCGYAAPSARMQYTSSSMADWLVGFLFRGALRPRVHRPAPLATFPAPVHFESHVQDVVLERLLEPLLRHGRWLLSFGRVVQQGRLHIYLLYVVLTLVYLLFRV